MTRVWLWARLFAGLRIADARRPLYQEDATVWVVVFEDGWRVLVSVSGRVLHRWKGTWDPIGV